MITVTTCATASAESLRLFTKADLRAFAKSIGVDRGRTKEDTIRHLIESELVTVSASLKDHR